mmetsp:Transcript_29473/g.50899  ORF Transcript_29473/g.50899 Transcript_29473/m.50899 type:complete len:139 (-) Transcript_29473:36-452(-)
MAASSQLFSLCYRHENKKNKKLGATAYSTVATDGTEWRELDGMLPRHIWENVTEYKVQPAQYQQQQELIQQQNEVMTQWMQRQPEPDGRGSATGMIAAGAPTLTALMATGAPTATATGLVATGGASQLPVAPAQPGAM